MRTMIPIVILGAALGALHPSAQTQTPQGRTEPPAFERAPDALERVTWRTRTLVGDDRLTQWKLAIRASGLEGVTFLDAVVRADAAGVAFVEGSSGQQVSRDLPNKLDHQLTADEIASVRARMGAVRMLAYRADVLPDAPASQRKVLELVKAMGAGTLVVHSAASYESLEPLAEEYGINVAILGHAAKPVRLMTALDGRGKRMGVAIDTGLWAEQGVSAQEALALVKDRLMYVLLRDRSAQGASARNVRLGEGVSDLKTAFHELNRLSLRPLSMTLDTTDVVAAPADLFPVVAAFEAAVQPAYGEYFTALSRTAPVRRDLVRPGRNEPLSADEIQRRSDEVRRKIEAAIPRQPYATPKQPRKLLVIDACLAGMSHDTIPHVNVMLEAMGRITGAWTAELNNDLNNLKYPKIKDYDAVFLNDNVGELLPDPAVRDGLARFVREGGGLGGVHGTPWASRNWDELAAMIGAKSAPHRIEQGVMKVFDASSPIVKPFGGKALNFREEYYRFEHDGPNRLRWDDVRVLLTVDLDDPAIEPRPWNGYKRPDNIYPVTWIRSYGKGRTFYSSLGHMPDTFMTPEIVGHFLAGVQFLLGDLDADTTPNPRQAAPPAAQAVPVVSQRPNGSSLGTIRIGAADNTFWFGWRVAMPAAAIKGLTFSDALARADVLSVAGVEASSTQLTSPEVPKPLDYRLQAGERNAIRHRLRELNQRVLAYRVDRIDGQIRGADRLTADMRQQIEAGAPRQAIVKPARPRRLLVTDLQMYSGHATIPHANLLLELMGRHTGAFEPTFSNDLGLLTYPKIKQFDAIS